MTVTNIFNGLLARASRGCGMNQVRPMLSQFNQQLRQYATLWEQHMFPRSAIRKEKKEYKKSLMDFKPQMKGVVLKTLIKKPKKPNSANRKCVQLRLSNGKEAAAFIPGIGHNLQEHNVVLVQGGRTQDVPGLKLVAIRGKYDLAHVKKK